MPLLKEEHQNEINVGTMKRKITPSYHIKAAGAVFESRTIIYGNSRNQLLRVASDCSVLPILLVNSSAISRSTAVILFKYRPRKLGWFFSADRRREGFG